MAAELQPRTESHDLVEYRVGTEADAPFIFSSWLRSFRQARSNHLVSPEVYFANQKAIVERILSATHLVVGVLANPDDREHIIGYVVAEWVPGGFVIHWLYVKATFRRMGFADVLLRVIEGMAAGSPLRCSHLSPNDEFFRRITSKYAITYNPELRR